MDNSLLKSDIFFFVTTLAVTFITLILGVLFLYILGIIRSLKRIVKTVETGADTVVEGLKDARDNIQEEGVVSSLIELFKKVSRQKRKTRK